MAEKLSLFEGVSVDEAIIKQQYHTYYPRTNNFNFNDEIRISINHMDAYLLPSKSHLYIEGEFEQVKIGAGVGDCKLTNNAYAFLFEQIRYELNGVEIDRCIKPGITSTMKAYVSLNDNESRSLEMAGWCPFENVQPTLSSTNKFGVYIPLQFIFGFAEDYNKIIMNASHELILVRSKTDDNCYKTTPATGTNKGKITIDKIEWHVPHVSVNDEMRLQLLEGLRNDTKIYIPFRKWDLYELPSLRKTRVDVWPIKSTSSLEKPRFVIVAFQTKKKDNFLEDATSFDHSDIENITLYLNSENYPYTKMNLSMSNKKYSIAYHMYKSFQESYYNRATAQPLLGFNAFQNTALYVIDCSKQNESVKSATVDIKLEMEGETAFKEGTAVYCLILHDNLIEYTPLSGTVKKII